MAEFFIQLKITARRLINRCPRRFRPLGGPILGGLIGLIGGIPGLLIGLLLGYLLRELFVQSFRDRNILDYFENPGLQQFYEPEPGLAAWCALAVLTSSAEVSAGAEVPAERIMKQVVLQASCVFTGPMSNPFLIEHFSRLALSKRNRLNLYLLAESLMARRASLGQGARDLGNLGRALSRLAAGEEARQLAREIRLILDPVSQCEFSEDEQEPGNSGPGIHGKGPKDPWKILGLAPGTPQREIKAHYRRLAKLFHPDELEVLDEQRRETAARAFMAIKEAYQEVISQASCKL